MICPDCEKPIIFIRIVRTTQAYMFYEDDVLVNIETQETQDLEFNSDETAGDTVDSWCHYQCPHCDTTLDDLVYDKYPYLTTFEQEYFEEEQC